jgi:hypothetical protein
VLGAEGLTRAPLVLAHRPERAPSTHLVIEALHKRRRRVG